MRTTVTLVALAIGTALGGAIVLWSGAYNVSAIEQHYRPTYWLLEIGMRRSIDTHARNVRVPPLDEPALIERGFVLYRAHCVQCHGAPGVAPEPFALGLTPAPANLVHTARAWSPQDLYWVVKNGIKMTGMPAWDFRLSERDLWAVVAFTRRLPLIAPEQLTAQERASQPRPPPFTTDEVPRAQPDAVRGKRAILQYACATCHVIPGIVGAYTPVGPPLERIATRQFLGGVLPNNRENMVRWLRDPPKFDPQTAMPNLGVSERDARDITAYLYTLD